MHVFINGLFVKVSEPDFTRERERERERGREKEEETAEVSCDLHHRTTSLTQTFVHLQTLHILHETFITLALG